METQADRIKDRVQQLKKDILREMEEKNKKSGAKLIYTIVYKEIIKGVTGDEWEDYLVFGKEEEAVIHLLENGFKKVNEKRYDNKLKSGTIEGEIIEKKIIEKK